MTTEFFRVIVVDFLAMSSLTKFPCKLRYFHSVFFQAIQNVSMFHDKSRCILSGDSNVSMFHNRAVTSLSLCDTADQNRGSTTPFALVLTRKNSNRVHGYKYYTSYKQNIDNIHLVQQWGPFEGKKNQIYCLHFFNLGLKLPQKFPYIGAFLRAHDIRLLILNLSDEYLCNFPCVTKIFPISTLNGKRELLI